MKMVRRSSRLLSGHTRTALYVAAFVFLPLVLAHAQPSGQVEKVLIKVADIPMPGPAVRFDYQSFDPASGRLYIAHMNADQLVVFDTTKRQVVANLDGFQRVHGVTVAAAYPSRVCVCHGHPPGCGGGYGDAEDRGPGGTNYLSGRLGVCAETEQGLRLR